VITSLSCFPKKILTNLVAGADFGGIDFSKLGGGAGAPTDDSDEEEEEEDDEMPALEEEKDEAEKPKPA
jgi:hypothetical protein